MRGNVQATSLPLTQAFISLDLPVQNAGLSQDKELISLPIELWLRGGFAASGFVLSGGRFCNPGFFTANKALCRLQTAASGKGQTQASVRPDAQNEVPDGLAAYQNRMSGDLDEFCGCFAFCLNHALKWIFGCSDLSGKWANV